MSRLAARCRVKATRKTGQHARVPLTEREALRCVTGAVSSITSPMPMPASISRTLPSGPSAMRAGYLRCALAGLAFLLITSTHSTSASAAEPHARFSPTSVTTPPASAADSAEVHALRALLEFESVFLLGWFYYLTTADVPGTLDVNYQWDTFRRKISGASFSADTNHFGTNFIGHPLGGAGYYLSARSNGFSPLASSGFSIGGSVLWEWFGEIREEISMNDMITTPLSGISIGETFYNIAGFFRRGSPTWYNRGLSTLLDPFTTINSALDGTAPQRVKYGYPQDVWHRLQLGLASAHVRELSPSAAAVWHPEAQLNAKVHLERFEVPTEPTQTELTTFSDGEISQFDVQVHLSSGGLSRVYVSTESVLAGLRYSGARSELNSESGYLGLSMGFTYSAHNYERHSSLLRRMSTARFLGLATGHHITRGPWTIDAWTSAGPAFGGVDTLAFTDDPYVIDNVPGTVRKQGYYFGLGGFAKAELEVRYRQFHVGTSLLGESFVKSPAPDYSELLPLADSHQLLSGYLGYQIPGTGNQLRMFLSRRGRTGSLNDNSEQFAEFTTGLSVLLGPTPQR